MKFLKKVFSINKWVFWGAFIGLVFSVFLPYKYPPEYRISELLQQDPLQTETQAERFEYINNEQIEIYVKPLYDYEISGLVVSDNGSYSWWSQFFPQMLGSRIKDLCVAWGDNVQSMENLQKIKFWNTNYTCYTQWRGGADAPTFNATQFSNNHLISADPKVRRKILSAKKGDQITIKGMLVEYGDAQTQRVERVSSVVRTDDGNGACETIYVKESEVVYANALKRFLKNFVVPLFWISFLLKLFQGMYYVYRVSKPPQK